MSKQIKRKERKKPKWGAWRVLVFFPVAAILLLVLMAIVGIMFGNNENVSKVERKTWERETDFGSVRMCEDFLAKKVEEQKNYSAKCVNSGSRFASCERENGQEFIFNCNSAGLFNEVITSATR